MYIYNSQLASKDNKVKQKLKKINIENRFQLKTGQIRGRINNIELTLLYLRQKRT